MNDFHTELLLFDLGGVFVHWDGISPLQRLSRRGLSAEDCRRFWLESPWVRLFERGRCSPEEFAHGVLEELDIALSSAEFLQEFISWDRGPMPGAVELLKDLVSEHRLACLSNNNQLHWERLKKEQGFERYFSPCFLSHEIGMVKPDREIFEYVLEQVSLGPSSVLFMDDNPECVEQAVNVGLQAAVVRGPGEVRRLLEDRGILGNYLEGH